MSKFNRTCIYM